MHYQITFLHTIPQIPHVVIYFFKSGEAKVIINSSDYTILLLLDCSHVPSLLILPCILTDSVLGHVNLFCQ